ncbi:CDGSH iron-sulfur domain-containing protein 1-like [Panonychus citri]|uniref:CDGSH iron-sulfur domain-containing protein 1-like n=1 Tax=Panonychus citri TaxID=50023 RepID=UPI0023080F57|nr:CDGSH iron-sulfur domain-containing protein 1-like [Panonychus citri]
MEGFQDKGSVLAYGFAFVSLAYAAYTKWQVCSLGSKINHSIQKDNAKVVHSFDIEDLGKNEVFCRCWKSKKFPYCDGAHNAHNAKCGDNIGPLIITRKTA